MAAVSIPMDEAGRRASPRPGYELLAARVVAFVRWVAWLTIFLSLLSGVFSRDFVVPLCGVGSGLLSLTALSYQRDILRLLLVAHPTLSYMFFTLAYGFFNGNPALNGLLNPGRAFTITLAYQFAILAADLFVTLLIGRNAAARAAEVDEARPLAMRAGWVLILVLVVFASARLTFLTAHTPVLVGLIVATVAWTVQARNGKNVASLAVMTLGAFFLISSITNGRTILLVMLLAWVLLLLAYAPRVLTFRNVVLGILCVGILNWVTYSFLEARKVRTETGEVFEKTLDIAFSEEGFLHLLLIPTGEQPNYDIVGSAYHSDFIRTSVWGPVDDSALSGRLALIAHMDIVTGRLPEPQEVDWDVVAGTIGSVLPNFGDKQELLYSDELVWGLSLRPRQSVGRPLVTAAGELYAIGGFQFILCAGFLMYAGIILLLSLMRRLTSNMLVYVVTGVAILGYVTLTGTFLGLMSTSFRMLPEFLLLLAFLGSFVKTEPNNSGSEFAVKGLTN
jgi:hypothetical protein